MAAGTFFAGSARAVDRIRPAAASNEDSYSTTSPSSSSASQPHLDPPRLDSVESVDTSNLPIHFLKSYPYPSFVLISRSPDAKRLPPLPWARSRYANLQQFEPIWSNRRWQRLSRGRPLLDGLSVDSASRLAEWLGSYLSEYEQALDEPGGSEKGSRPWRPRGAERKPSITLDFAFGSVGVVLQLSKTYLPIHRPDEAQHTRSPTHAFAVVTTTPVELRAPVTIETRASQSCASSSTAVVYRETSAMLDSMWESPPEEAQPDLPVWDDAQADHDETSGFGPLEPGRPLYVFSDGSFVNSSASGPTEEGSVSDVATLLESTDWSATPLGPREMWPSSLQASVKTVMEFPFAAGVWWGKELTMVYNQLLADKIPGHPKAFGRSGASSWAEMWRLLGPLSDVVRSGTPVVREDAPFLEVTRKFPRLHEVFRTQLWLPLRDDLGQNVGIYLVLHDTTLKVLAERRAIIQRTLAQRTCSKSLDDFNRALLDTLEEYPRDVPFALIFQVESTGPNSQSRKMGSGASSIRGPASSVRLRYTGGVGVPDGHPSAPARCTVELLPGEQPTEEMMASAFTALETQTGARPNFSSLRRVIFNTDDIDHSTPDEHQPAPARQWPLAEVLQARRPIVVRDCSRLIEGYPLRVWDELPTSAIVIPISDCDTDFPGAVLVLGLSCRLPFDTEYQAFLRTLRVQLSALFAAARFYEEENKRAEELADLERAKKLLLANVSHDLVTPLSLIAGPLDDVLAETPAGRQRDSLNMARRSVQRLSRLVDMLMDLSSLEAGNMACSFRRVNLGEVTRNVAAMFRQALDAVHLDYIVDCDMEDRDVYIDRDKYEKILFTLIGNALRFTCVGTVRVAVRYKDGEAAVSVEDTGVGIPAKDLVFGDKYPIDDAFIQAHQGWGVSLLFTKKLVQLHHGSFNIESRTAEESADGSHGTCFTVSLPLGTEHLPSDSVETSHVSDGTPLQQFHQSVLDSMSRAHWASTSIPKEDALNRSTPSRPFSTDLPSRGIDPSTVYFQSTDIVLLVDSLFDTRQYMRNIFEPFCKVIQACDGCQAIEMVNQHHPNLIIADVMLPKMSGFELVTKLKNGTAEQQMVPIILLTSMQDARADGAFAADDYMPKPFNARELIARAHMQLQLGKKRRALESAFDMRTQELRLLTEYSPVGIFRCSEDGYVHYANQAWYEISGYPSSQPVTNWGDYVVEEHQERIGQIWRQYIRKQAIHETAEWQWKNGRWVAATVIRVNSDGAPANIIGCTVDITERKLNERMHREQVLEAEERRAAAEEARQQQELLIDITSHEIRNPISSLMQCASLVKSHALALHEQMRRAVEEDREIKPTEQLLVMMTEDIEALDSIYQCGLTQERISNDVLSLGKIQLGMLQMFDTETDIRKEAQKIIFVFQNEARMKRLNLRLNIGHGFQRLKVDRIMIDPVRLGQVVTNLLSNAIRFTSNSPVRKVELRLDLSVDPPTDGCAMPLSSTEVELNEDTPLYLYVSVSDTGPGLTAAELQVLFQRFSQASSKTHTVYGGSGLGLFVCRQLTERMGGQIDVVSEYGRGSEFRFYVRTRACLSSQTQTSAESPTNDNVANDPSGTFKPHILVVEDNVINRTVLVRQLKHVGLSVESASNGLEALEKLRLSQRPGKRTGGSNPDISSCPTSGSANNYGTHTSSSVSTPPGGKGLGRYASAVSKDPKDGDQPKRFDCVLMDLEMPIMDGYTSVRLLRADEAKGLLVPTNVVALTGNARQAQVPEAMADFTDVVVKPYRLDNLLQTIDDSIVKHANDAPRSSGESMRSASGAGSVSTPAVQAQTEPSQI